MVRKVHNWATLQPRGLCDGSGQALYDGHTLGPSSRVERQIEALLPGADVPSRFVEYLVGCSQVIRKPRSSADHPKSRTRPYNGEAI